MTTKQAASASASNQQQKLLLAVIVIVVVAAAAVIAIVLSGRPSVSAGPERYANVPQSRMPDGGFVLGNPDAPITIVEFSDFLCPHCQDYEPTVVRFIDEFVLTGKAKFEYRMLPAVDPTLSPLTARLVECADTLEPGSFWYAHDVMFELTSASRFSQETPRTFAARLGLDYGDLLTCSQTAKQVETDMALGSEAGVQGTPSVLVRYRDGELIWPLGGPSRGSALSFDQLALLVQSAPQE